MSCVYSDFLTGKCSIADDGLEIGGCDERGICVCQDDEDPSEVCSEYESEED